MVTATDGAARAGVLTTAHGEVPTPAFMPHEVCPVPSPQVVLPVGNVATSAAPSVGDHRLANVCAAPATSGRSPSPVLETVPLDTCT